MGRQNPVLDEFVLEVTLPSSDVARVLRAAPDARVALLPLSTNGAGHPHRFLVAASRCGKMREPLEAALTACFTDVVAAAAPEDGFSFTATLPEPLMERLRHVTGGRLGDGTVEVMFRPALAMDGRLFAAGVVVRGAFEGTLQVTVARLAEAGLTARLVRASPFHPGLVAPAAYEEALTPKQGEVLRMALALGHYDTPRRCTLDDLAAIFGISKAAAGDRIRSAERKVLSARFQ